MERGCSSICEQAPRGQGTTLSDELAGINSIFLTNDKKLKQIKEIKVLVLADYL